MILRKLVDGVDERLDGTSFLKRNLRKVFPGHWSFLLGEVTLYCFVLLVLTGIFLTFFYVASPEATDVRGPYAPLQGQTVSQAYASVLRISFEVRAGLVMRQIHHWAALVFMWSLVAHLVRVFFTGAFRKPRELSWIAGVTLLLSGIGAGFTGYSLPDDLLSGTGLRITYSVVLSIPFVGTWLAFLFFGGEFPSPELLPRLFIMHVLLIPLLLMAMLGAHLAMVWHQTHTQYRGARPHRRHRHGHAGVAEVRAQGHGGGLPDLGDPGVPRRPLPDQPRLALRRVRARTRPRRRRSPTSTPGGSKASCASAPNWEFHIFGHSIGNLFLFAVVLPGIVFTVLAIWPFLEARVTKDRATHHFAQRPREAPVRSAIGAAGITWFVVLMLAGSNDVLAKYLQVEVDTLNAWLRVFVFVLPAVAGVDHLLDLPRSRPSRDPADPRSGPRDLPTHRGRRLRRGARGLARRARERGALAMRRCTLLRVCGADLLGAFAASCSSSFGMPRGGTEQGQDIFSLWQTFMIAGIVVGVLVYGLIAWSLIRYRHRKRDAADARGRSFDANVPLEVVYTLIPVVIVVVLFALSFRTEDRVDAVSPSPDVTLHAEAFAWGWHFTYGDTGPTVVSPPSGLGVTGPTIELPLGRTTRVVLTSNDVIHAFWVPGFLFKRDAIPGRTTAFDLTPTDLGTYQGVCAEFCGLNHAFMTFTVRVVEPQEFSAWLATQPSAEASP